MKEKLSAFMDDELNELDERRLLAALAADPALRAAWGRYHLIRSALRREPVAAVRPGLATAVAGRLAAAPATRHGRLAATLALAASVAAVAVVGVQWLYRPGAEPAAPLAADATSHPERLRAGVTRWDTNRPEVESALNAYLVEHNEFAPTSGVGDMLPYVRVVGYDSRQ